MESWQIHVTKLRPQSLPEVQIMGTIFLQDWTIWIIRPHFFFSSQLQSALKFGSLISYLLFPSFFASLHFHLTAVFGNKSAQVPDLKNFQHFYKIDKRVSAPPLGFTCLSPVNWPKHTDTSVCYLLCIYTLYSWGVGWVKIMGNSDKRMLERL